MKLSNVGLLYKVLACIALLAVVVTGATWFATSQMVAMDTRYSDLIARNAKGVRAVSASSIMSTNFGRLMWRSLATPDAAEIGKLVDDAATDATGFRTYNRSTQELLPDFASRLEVAGRLFEEASAMFDAKVKPFVRTDRAAAQRAALEVAKRLDELRLQLRDIVLDAEKAMQKASDQATEETVRAVQTTIGLVAVALLGAIILSVLMVQLGVVRPLRALSGAMERLAKGEYATEVDGADRKDEVGLMARSVQVFKRNGLEMEKLRADQVEAEKRAAAERQAAVHKIADEFEAAVGAIVGSVSAASTELEAAATSLTDTAQTTRRLSTTVAAASEQASANVQSVATGGQEMAASVNEISRQVNESTRIAGEAVRQAEKTDTRIGQLSSAASRIGDVVKLITAIAEQTNLLALNATIEAARAGEAGKGFAVVAQEVKALAAQTAKATGEISSQISEMQSATQDSVSAIKEISGTIGRISEIAGAIAAAVEEQGAATHEVARNIQQASQGTAEVARTIVEVSRGANATEESSHQVRSSAAELAEDSARLKDEVKNFLLSVRTGPLNRRVKDDPDYKGPERRADYLAARQSNAFLKAS